MKKGLVVRSSERGHERATSRAAPWNLCIGKEAENYPPVDEIVLIVRVMADHRRFQTFVVRPRSTTSSSHALLSIPPPSFSLAENTNRGEAPINFQLYTHHDRNSTLLFPLVTRRCTWRTIGFLHHRKGEGGERENPSIHGARRGGSRLPSPTSYRSLLYFVMPPCHPSIYRDAGIVA